jgi:hypothetical protein
MEGGLGVAVDEAVVLVDSCRVLEVQLRVGLVLEEPPKLYLEKSIWADWKVVVTMLE